MHHKRRKPRRQVAHPISNYRWVGNGKDWSRMKYDDDAIEEYRRGVDDCSEEAEEAIRKARVRHARLFVHFDTERVKAQLRETCRQEGIDLDELLEGASKHFQDDEPPRGRGQATMSDEVIDQLATEDCEP